MEQLDALVTGPVAYPASHGKHTPSPRAALKLPGAQGEQLVPLGSDMLRKPGRHTHPSLLLSPRPEEDVNRGHGVQASLPCFSL